MSEPAAAQVEATRRRAGLIRLSDRGVIEVSGSERVRWLDGMVTAEILALTPGSGTPALILTRQGRIVADLHVLALEDAFWLELEAAAIPAVLAHLNGFIIADDVSLADLGAGWVRFALEGPALPQVLGALGADPEGLAENAWTGLELAGHAVRAAAYGFTGELAVQLFAPRASAEALEADLLAAGAGSGLVAVGQEAFEILRVEAGTPWLGRDLDESVLPAEARLEHAVSDTKGCYTGQEVVARLRSRDRIGQLLVGLRYGGPDLPEPGAELQAEGRKIGEATSGVNSPRFGAIGLGYVKRELAEPGTRVEVVLGGRPGTATVAALPFVPE